MTDDIVKRLRSQHRPCSYASCPTCEQNQRLAADEIERLTAERDEWSVVAVDEAHMVKQLRAENQELQGKYEKAPVAYYTSRATTTANGWRADG